MHGNVILLLEAINRSFVDAISMFVSFICNNEKNFIGMKNDLNKNFQSQNLLELSSEMSYTQIYIMVRYFTIETCHEKSIK